MSSIIKSISLDPKTSHIAKRVPNFSKFVRECLLRWDAIQRSPDCPVERLGHPLVGDHCVPAPTRICLKHWPNGTPRMEDWREFRSMIERAETGNSYLPESEVARPREPGDSAGVSDNTSRKRKIAADWVQDRAKQCNLEQIEFDDLEIEGNAKPTTREKKSKIRRLWAVLWARNR